MLIARLIVAAVLLAGLGGLGTGSAHAQMGPSGPITFALYQQSGSGQMGNVTLTPQGGQTRVTIHLFAQPAGTTEPAHIHQGTCANLNPAPLYPLNNVVNGVSDTVVNASLQQIMSAPHAVNVHRSPQEIQVYVACGDLSLANQFPRNQPGVSVTLAGAPPAGVPSMAGPRPPAGPQTMTQMPRGMGAMGPMPVMMPRTGDVPLGFVALAGLGAAALGLLVRRRAA